MARGSVAAGCAAAVFSDGASASRTIGSRSGMAALRGIFDVRDFGAAGDGKTLDTARINAAVEACSGSGGGVVTLPPGNYLSGTVILRSNVVLHLAAGATLLGSTNLKDYVDNPVTGTRHLIFARGAENIGVVGPGRIDGQGDSFWRYIPRSVPQEDSWKDVATYDYAGDPLRPIQLLEFAECRNLRIEALEITNSPCWTLRPIACDSVFIRGVVIRNSNHGPSTDGIDPTCSQNVFISDCTISTGDDAICLKSENPYGTVRASKNITITNCVLTTSCNGIKFGTATQGVLENITISNCVIYNDQVDLSARVIAGLALEMVDGGRMEGVTISNVRMQNVRTPIFIRLGNRGASQRVPTPGTIRGIMLDNVYATGAVLTSSITGLPGNDVEDVSLANIRIDSDEGGKAEWVKTQVPELPEKYPEARMFGRLPSFGLYCRHVNGLRLRNVALGAARSEMRPAILCDDVKNIDIDSLQAPPVGGGQPLLKFMQARKAFIRGCSAPEMGTFLEVAGNQSRAIVVMGNDFSSVERAVSTAPEVEEGSVTMTGNYMRHV
jgi:polygalacturonase